MADKEQWPINEDKKDDVPKSSSPSSFKAMESHDPGINRLTLKLFANISEYIESEMKAGMEDASLLESLNQQSIMKFREMRNMLSYFVKVLRLQFDRNDAFLKPLLMQIDTLDAKLSHLESTVMQLDEYTKKLRIRFRNINIK